MYQIILASGSPRRSELLGRAGIRHKVVAPGITEDMNGKGPVAAMIRGIALAKAADVRKRCPEQLPVVAADTAVCLGGRILGKPAGKPEAYDMLKSLSGRWHKVITGFCVMWGEDDYICDHAVTKVKFRRLEISDITDYIQTDEPYDKAGAYGIQSLGSVFVEKIRGCYCNVMGLPVSRILGILKEHKTRMSR